MADRTRRFRFSVSMLLVSLLFAACGGGDSGNGNGDSNDDDGESVNEAQAIFIEVGCAECHGEQAEGVDGEGSSLQGTRMIFNAFETRVRNGRGQQMPAFSEEEISDEQVELVYEWLQSQ